GRLGLLGIVSSRVLADSLGPLGPDPLADGWNLTRLNGTSRPVKVALLDQRLVAGIGNIYASESLWRARIDPRRRSDRLDADKLRRLRRAIIESLRKASGYGPPIFEGQRCGGCDSEG